MSYSQSSEISAAAAEEFNTSSLYPVPDGYQSEPWKIRNDYPTGESIVKIVEDAPWLKIDFRTHPKEYMDAVKKYILDGMVECGFIPQDNKVRDWYHPPWLHRGTPQRDREPLRGLTYQRSEEMSMRGASGTQTKVVDLWAISFFNAKAATVFGNMWEDPANPKWDRPIKCGEGCVVYKIMCTTATDIDLPFLEGSPVWEAAIDYDFPDKTPAAYRRAARPRKVRVFQVDFAVSDNRSECGWVFGTFMYDGRREAKKWAALKDIGITWGNDPDLTQKRYEDGDRVKETWINQDRDTRELLEWRGDGRKDFGWNGRLNGPGDNFISCCISCHQACQWPPGGYDVVPPPPDKDYYGNWIPKNDEETMKWFKNLRPGESRDGKGISGGISLQLQIGYKNFQAWKSQQEGTEFPPEWDIPAHPARADHAHFESA